MKDLSERVLADESATVKLGNLAKLRRATGEKIVSFALGEPSDNTPQFALNAAKDAIDGQHTKYTFTQGTIEVRQAVSQWMKDCYGLDYDFGYIVISNGAKHSIFNAILSIVDIDEEVIIPSPYWVSYPNIVSAAGAKPIIVDTSKTGFKLTAESLENTITKRTKLVIINTPNNPSGVVYSKFELEELAKIIIEYDLYVLADEIYGNFVYDGVHTSVAGIAGLKERTILVGGMSKDFAMTGLRIGWSLANAEITKACTVMQSHTTSCANSIAQETTRAVLCDTKKAKDYIASMLKQYDEHRLLMMEGLDKLSMEYVMPKGAFYVLCSIKQFVGQIAYDEEIDTAATFANLLLDKVGLVVVPCESSGIENYIRLSYTCSKRDIIDGIKKMETFINEIEMKV